MSPLGRSRGSGRGGGPPRPRPGSGPREPRRKRGGAGPPPDYSDARIVSIARDDAGRLVVAISTRNEPLVDASVARCFPWSSPEQYISVRDADGHEIGLLGRLDELDDDSRQVVREELRDKVFNPKVLAILEFKSEFGVINVRARTDRGDVSFQVRSRDDVRLLGSDRALLRDADGNTYEVENVSQLDPVSRRRLSTYL